MQNSNVQDLVCQRCWSDFFNTSAFQEACNAILGDDGENAGPVVTQVISLSQLKDVKTDCNWCSIALRYFSLDSGRYGGLEEKPSSFMIGLVNKNNDWRDRYTPAGRNVWEFTIAWLDGETYCGTDAYLPYLTARTEPGDNAAGYVTARPVQLDVSTDSTTGQIQHWLEFCTLHHACSKRVKAQLPLRVIDVGSACGVSTPKLHVTYNEIGEYAALSYCWGGAQAGALTRSNIHQYCKALPMDNISQSIKDAIQVTKAVGLKYLWVDALCILQDDGSDKLEEICRMDEVYRNALFTIVAESASSAMEGFLQPRTPPCLPQYRIPFRCSNGTFGSMSVNLEPHDRVVPEPLKTRAWAFQEALLSQRKLIYTSSTLKWACLDGQYHLSDALCKFDIDIPHPRDLQSKRGQETPAGIWALLVEHYSDRKATDSADRLIALSAIAKAVASRMNCKYLAGLWEDQLVDQLHWRRGRNIQAARPSVYRAPSWSWASIEGQVHLVQPHDGGQALAKVIHCEVLLVSHSAPFGAVKDAWLIIEGPLRRGLYQGNSRHGPKIEWRDNFDNHKNQDFDIYAVEFDVGAERIIDLSFDFLLLRLEVSTIKTMPNMKAYGLILLQQEDGTHRRVGTFRVECTSAKASRAEFLFPVTRVKII